MSCYIGSTVSVKLENCLNVSTQYETFTVARNEVGAILTFCISYIISSAIHYVWQRRRQSGLTSVVQF